MTALRKRKTIAAVMPEPPATTDSSGPSSSLTETTSHKKHKSTKSETHEIIPTDNIPDLDFDPENPIDVTPAKKTNVSKRHRDESLGFLDPEEDLTAEGPPDIAHMTRSEARRLLNGEHADYYNRAFQAQMEKKEQDFQRNFHKQQGGGPQSGVTRQFKEQEYERILKIAKQQILTQAQAFDVNDPAIDFTDVQVPEPAFNPGPFGFGRFFAMSAEESVTALTQKRVERTADQMKKILKIADVEITDQFTDTPELDYLTEIIHLFNSTKETHTETLVVVNLASPGAVTLMQVIARLILNGSRCSPRHLFEKIADEFGEVSLGTRKLGTLQTDIKEAMKHKTEGHSLQFATGIVAYLLSKGSLSDVFRVLAKLSEWRASNYYKDSVLLSKDVCESLAILIEQIECTELEGEFPLKRIPDVLPPVTPKSWAIRLQGAVTEYYDLSRNWLMNGDDLKLKHLDPISVIIRLMIECFLSTKTGDILKMDQLWMLMEAAAEQKNKFIVNNPYRPADVPQEFVRFVQIVQEKAKEASPVQMKGMSVIIKCLNSHLTPYLPLFLCQAASKVRGFENSLILSNEADTLSIAGSLFLLKDPQFNISDEDIKERISI